MNRTINGITDLAELIASLNTNQVQELAETLFAKNPLLAEDLSGTITWAVFDKMVENDLSLDEDPVDNA